MTRWHAFVPILMIALLQGCATGGAVRGVATEPDKGTIVVRPTFAGFKYVNNYSLLVRKVGSQEEAFSLGSWSMASEGYWTRYYDDIERGELVVMSVPAGEYEIHGWWIGASGWGGLRHSVAKDRLSYRFRVEPGKAIYLGNVHVAVTGDTGITPAAFTTAKYKATSSVRDTRARDFAELPKLAPGLAPERVEVRLLR
jgi:hypothetical protein